MLGTVNLRSVPLSRFLRYLHLFSQGQRLCNPSARCAAKRKSEGANMRPDGAQQGLTLKFPLSLSFASQQLVLLTVRPSDTWK